MPFHLTKEQRITAVKFYYQNNENGAAAGRLLAEHFQIKHVIQGRNITNLVKKFEETGNINDAPRTGRPVSATTNERGDNLIASLTGSPQKSVRRLSDEHGISITSVWRLLHKRKMKPYIPRLVQALHDGDQDRRVQFAEEFLDRVAADDTFINRIWWSDEASFKLNGHINRHNCVFWCADNPRVVLEKEINLPGVTVWAAISPQGIIGPVFFDGTVTSQSYLEMLQTHLWPRIKDTNDYFQQDGAPPHYGRIVRDWLDQNLRDRWIGRRGPMDWPARSPDLTPPDFFLWGVLKHDVYSENPRTIPELKDIIRQKCLRIGIELCEKACQSVIARMRKCIQVEGEVFEHYE